MESGPWSEPVVWSLCVDYAVGAADAVAYEVVGSGIYGGEVNDLSSAVASAPDGEEAGVPKYEYTWTWASEEYVSAPLVDYASGGE